ncbi:hypothetical protein CapIbe_023325 [Capra ibex]
MPRERGRLRSSGRCSRTAHAELSSMSHMERLLREGHYAQRLSSSTLIFLAAIIGSFGMTPISLVAPARH